jgi:hypothetical protein
MSEKIPHGDPYYGNSAKIPRRLLRSDKILSGAAEINAGYAKPPVAPDSMSGATERLFKN